MKAKDLIEARRFYIEIPKTVKFRSVGPGVQSCYLSTPKGEVYLGRITHLKSAARYDRDIAQRISGQVFYSPYEWESDKGKEGRSANKTDAVGELIHSMGKGKVARPSKL